MRFSFLVPALLLVLSGCTFWKEGDTDFASLYSEHVRAEISSVRDWAKELGYMESYEAVGSVAASVDIPAILSGAVSAAYEGRVHGQDVSLTVKNPSLQYETILASGSLLAKQIDMVSLGKTAYFRYDDLATAGLLGEEVLPVLDQYKNTWLMLDTALSGSGADATTDALSDALSRMSLSDIESYLTRYPLWKEEKNLGMSGELMQFEVSLAKENILAMIGAFTEKATGKGLTDEQKTSLSGALSAVNITGVIGWDPKNVRHMSARLMLSTPEGETADIEISKSSDTFLATLSASGSVSTWSSKKDETGYVFSFVSRDSGVEIVRIDGTSKRIDGVYLLDVTASSPAQGLSVTLSHKVLADGTFDGRLNAGVGTLAWTGTLEKSGLKELHLAGAMIGTTLALDLVGGTDGMMRGPFTVKSGETVAIAANIGLRATKEELTLSVDIPSPSDASISSRADISIIGKRSPWSGTIEAPKDAKSFEAFSQALEAVMPIDTFVEADPSLENTGTNTNSITQ